MGEKVLAAYFVITMAAVVVGRFSPNKPLTWWIFAVIAPIVVGICDVIYIVWRP